MSDALSLTCQVCVPQRADEPAAAERSPVARDSPAPALHSPVIHRLYTHCDTVTLSHQVVLSLSLYHLRQSLQHTSHRCTCIVLLVHVYFIDHPVYVSLNVHIL